MSIDTSILDEIIVGRVEPHIYAFSTNTIPNYLKVGDTYRSVLVRLNEWRAHYPNLQKQFEKLAVIDDSYFRDYSVHEYLENIKGKVRLQKTDLSAGVFYSREFFKDATVADVVEAIEDIEADYHGEKQKYQYYNVDSHHSEEFKFVRNQNFDLRPNQRATVERFKTAVKNGRKNLLMYAVMRFGKSFTAMCCAVEMGAKLVVITSAKADVLLEWKRTVESHVKFAEYDFIFNNDVIKNENIISDTLSSGRKAVVFLTLQDLQGDVIKEKHKDLFKQQIDLLLIDETHFGARAEKYGEVLKSHGLEKDIDEKLSSEELLTLENYNEIISKELSAKIRIHLSGTPYKILMGSEFSEEDRIAFYQFTDIVQDQEAWDREHVLDDDYKEWDNPYYGFPQIVRFAFNPNESSRKRLEELKSNGVTYAFSALFKPQSVRKTKDGRHKKFVYAQEILDLLQVIDGSKDDNALLGFLNYDKIKTGKMCRHIVIVLPYCASCDALEELISVNSAKFKNISEYEIVNISGVDSGKLYKTPDIIKQKIKDCESADKKTITLTVNRMLTGSTVPEWDTMLYLKDTASPQEYDQAIFRLQNHYIKTCVDKNGDTIKLNMKPQTLLVDFDPNRMFVMQEKKAQIYNVNIDEAGNSKLGERLEVELRISPIICLNKDKIVQVTATDILEAVSNYKKDKGIKEEALDTPVDLDILKYDIVKAVIEQENEIGSKSGLAVPAHKGNEDDGESDITTPDTDNVDTTNSSTHQTKTNIPDDKKEQISFTKKIQSYYTKILLFAFITDDKIISLKDIIDKIDSPENARIAKNLGLNKPILTILNNHNKWVLRQLDYKIQDLNGLSHDEEISPTEKAEIAVHKFGKLGDAIVITPSKICEDMVSLLPDSFIIDIADKKGRILDIAGTSGEFAAAIYKRMTALGIDKDVIENSIYTIPKSSICYELTRKLYSMLNLNVDNIAQGFIATDLLEFKKDNELDYGKIKSLLSQNKKFSTISLKDNLTEGDETMTFDAIVGNPPYQEETSGNSTGTNPIYHYFLELSQRLGSINVFLTPARFLFNAGKTPKSWNQKMLKDRHLKVALYEQNPEKMIPGIPLTGGFAVSIWDKNTDNEPIGTFVPYNHLQEIVDKVRRYNDFESINKIIYIHSKFDLKKIYETNSNYKNLVGSNGRDRRVRANAFDVFDFFKVEPQNANAVRVLGLHETKRTYRYINREFLEECDWVNKYKVFVPESNGASGMLGDEAARIISHPALGLPNDGVTQTFIVVGSFETQEESNNLMKYILSKFCRLLLGSLKATQRNNSSTWLNVPLQDFSDNSDIDWSKSIPEIDKQLYAKYDLNEDEITFIESMIKSME